MGIELIVGPVPEEADLRLDRIESIDELEDELRDLLRAAAQRIVILDLHASPRAAVTVPDAVRVLVEVRRAFAEGPIVRCVLASEAAQRAAERVVPELHARERCTTFGALTVVVVQGDIVRVAADAIVNANNVRLELGAGVSGAIRRAVANPDALETEMYARAPLPPGDVVATSSHGLPTARHILHAATASGREEDVGRAYSRLLEEAERMGIATVAVPALGCGTGGLAASRSAELLRDALEKRSSGRSLSRVICVLWDAATADAFAEVLSAT